MISGLSANEIGVNNHENGEVWVLAHKQAPVYRCPFHVRLLLLLLLL